MFTLSGFNPIFPIIIIDNQFFGATNLNLLNSYDSVKSWRCIWGNPEKMSCYTLRKGEKIFIWGTLLETIFSLLMIIWIIKIIVFLNEIEGNIIKWRFQNFILAYFLLLSQVSVFLCCRVLRHTLWCMSLKIKIHFSRIFSRN